MYFTWFNSLTYTFCLCRLTNDVYTVVNTSRDYILQVDKLHATLLQIYGVFPLVLARIPMSLLARRCTEIFFALFVANVMIDS